jgi:hypothetical protein
VWPAALTGGALQPLALALEARGDAEALQGAGKNVAQAPE